MDIYQSVFPEVLEIDPLIHGDSRGGMSEIYRQGLVEEMTGRRVSWKQGNVSVSRVRTIRGLHYSVAPVGQEKYVTCFHGMVWDVVVDVREGSPTFGAYQGFTLSGETFKSLYIPTGFAHGFVAMTDNAVVGYQLSSTYSPEHEHGISPFDPRLGLGWVGVIDPILSEKDKKAPSLEQARAQGMLPRYVDTTPEER